MYDLFDKHSEEIRRSPVRTWLRAIVVNNFSFCIYFLASNRYLMISSRFFVQWLRNLMIRLSEQQMSDHAFHQDKSVWNYICYTGLHLPCFVSARLVDLFCCFYILPRPRGKTEGWAISARMLYVSFIRIKSFSKRPPSLRAEPFIAQTLHKCPIPH